MPGRTHARTGWHRDRLAAAGQSWPRGRLHDRLCRLRPSGLRSGRHRLPAEATLRSARRRGGTPRARTACTAPTDRSCPSRAACLRARRRAPRGCLTREHPVCGGAGWCQFDPHRCWRAGGAGSTVAACAVAGTVRLHPNPSRVPGEPVPRARAGAVVAPRAQRPAHRWEGDPHPRRQITTCRVPIKRDLGGAGRRRREWI